MNDNTIDRIDDQESNKLPVFLKVLCILTFIGSGLGFLSGLVVMLVLPPETLYEIMQAQAAKVTAVIPPYEEYAQWSMYNTIVTFTCTLLGLLGGLMMYKRKKNGFYIYVFSWVASLAMTMISHKHVASSADAELFPIVMVLTGLIMTAFIIMYSVNLKHMK